MVEQMRNDGKDTTELQAALAETPSKLRIGAGMAKTFGVFLLALFGMGIAAGVVLFMGKAATFALLVGVLQVIADGLSAFFWSHIGVTNLIGIGAGVLVIVAAISIKGRSPATLPAPAM